MLLKRFIESPWDGESLAVVGQYYNHQKSRVCQLMQGRSAQVKMSVRAYLGTVVVVCACAHTVEMCMVHDRVKVGLHQVIRQSMKQLLPISNKRVPVTFTTQVSI